MTEKRRGEYIGQIALELGLVSMEDIGRALELQQDYRRAGNRVPRLGEIFVGMGVLGVEDVRDLLRRQNTMLGEVPADIESEEEEAGGDSEAGGFGGEPERSSVGCEYSEGEKFSNYNLLRRVGYGPLGSAWCATYGEDKKKQLLLRIFSAEAMDGSCELVKNFEHHIIKATRLEHSGIQRIIRGGLYDDRYYYVCEFDEGQSLRAFLEETGRFSPGKTLELLMQASAALQYGHGKDFLHNHISPSSIIVLPGFEVKLSAYGMMPDPVGNIRLMARELGKMPFYVAPELIAASGSLSAATTASDFFSLGAVMYHCLVGLPPFYAATVEEVLPLMRDTAGLELKLMDAEVDPELVRLTMAMLAPDPTQRIKTAGELMVALAPLVDRFPFKKPKAENDRKLGIFANKGKKKRLSGRQDKALPTDRPQRIEEPKSGMSGRCSAGERNGTGVRKDGTGTRKDGTGTRKDSGAIRRGGTAINKDGTGSRRDTSVGHKDGTASTKDETGTRLGGAPGRPAGVHFAHKVKTETGDDLTLQPDTEPVAKRNSTRIGAGGGWQSSRAATEPGKRTATDGGKKDETRESVRSSRRTSSSERRSGRLSGRRGEPETQAATGGKPNTMRIIAGVAAGVVGLAGLMVYYLRTVEVGVLDRRGNYTVELKKVADAEDIRKEKERLIKEALAQKEKEAQELAARLAEEAKAKAAEEAQKKADADKAAAEKAAAKKLAAEKAAEAKNKAVAEVAQPAEAAGEAEATEVPVAKSAPVGKDAEEEEAPKPAKRRLGGTFLVDPDQ